MGSQSMLSKCLKCGKLSSHSLKEKCDDCGFSWFDTYFDLEHLKKKSWIDNKLNSMWRYFELLPLKDKTNIISLHEGYTPIFHLAALEKELGLKNILLKDERRNPTGTFKDRQGSLAVSLMKENGITEFVVCSTGNVAISYAAYSAKAGIKVWAFLPENALASKVKEIAKYGGEVIVTNFNYDDAKKEAETFANERGLYYDSGGSMSYNRESKKTIAYEICEQLDWDTPDWYIQAVSGGPGPLGVWKGFMEFYHLGLIKSVPKIACVQTNKCAPMVKAFEKQLKHASPIESKTEIPTLGTGNPGFSYNLLYERIRSTGGTFIEADENATTEIIDTVSRSEGIYISPSSAIAFGGLIELVNQKQIKDDETVLVNCTGDGIRWPSHI